MVEMDANDTEPTYGSYADHIEDMYENTPEWLRTYFREGHMPAEMDIDDGPDTACPDRIYVLDSVANMMKYHIFLVSPSALIDQQFLDLLYERSPQRRTRNLMVQSCRARDMYASYLDAIGLHYRLNPCLFAAYMSKAREERAGEVFIRNDWFY